MRETRRKVGFKLIRVVTRLYALEISSIGINAKNSVKINSTLTAILDSVGIICNISRYKHFSIVQLKKIAVEQPLLF